METVAIYCPNDCPEPLVWHTATPDGDYAVCPGCGRRFVVQDGVLLLEAAACEADFPAGAIGELSEAESSHFWLRARNRILRSMLGRADSNSTPPQFLDVGCGTGAVSAWLQSLGYHTTGLDMHVQGLKQAARRCSTLQVCCDARKMPFRDAFDLVGLFDVIEHVDDDADLLRQCRKALKPGGRLVLTVPADMRLWSSYDDVFGHKRRYTRRQLIHVIKRSGYLIERVSYYNTLLWPIQFILRRWQRMGSPPVYVSPELMRRYLTPPPRPINAILELIMSLEALWVRRVSGPFGAALIAVARRPTK